MEMRSGSSFNARRAWMSLRHQSSRAAYENGTKRPDRRRPCRAGNMPERVLCT